MAFHKHFYSKTKKSQKNVYVQVCSELTAQHSVNSTYIYVLWHTYIWWTMQFYWLFPVHLAKTQDIGKTRDGQN